MRPLLPLVVAAIVLASGCLSGAGSGAKQPATPVANESAKGLGNATLVDDGSTTASANASAGAVPHKHDYWKGKERVTVLDQDVAISVQDRNAFLPLFIEQRPALGWATVSLPDGQIVFEGTGRLEFTATWTDPTVTGLKMRYQSTGNPFPTGAMDVESGKVIAVDVKPEMTDEPHAASSGWQFHLEASGPSGAGVASGTVRVKVDIVKMRDIETFPAHPDLFQGLPFAKLLDKDMTIKSDSAVDNLQSFQSGKFDPPGFPPEKPVPPTSKSVLVKLDVKSVTTNNPVGDASKIDMPYRTARSAFRYEDAKLDKQDGKSYVFVMPVKPGDGDSFYAKASQWRFDPVVQDNVQGQEANCFFGDCFTWSMDVHVTVWAFLNEATAADVPKAP